jgi:hypothetical protein
MPELGRTQYLGGVRKVHGRVRSCARAHCLGAVVLTWLRRLECVLPKKEASYLERDRLTVAICELEGLGDLVVEGACLVVSVCHGSDRSDTDVESPVQLAEVRQTC